MTTDISQLDPIQIWMMISGILAVVSGTSIWKLVKLYGAILVKDLHIVRLGVDVLDNFAQDPNDQTWTKAWNQFASMVRSKIPAQTPSS